MTASTCSQAPSPRFLGRVAGRPRPFPRPAPAPRACAPRLCPAPAPRARCPALARAPVTRRRFTLDLFTLALANAARANRPTAPLHPSCQGTAASKRGGVRSCAWSSAKWHATDGGCGMLPVLAVIALKSILTDDQAKFLSTIVRAVLALVRAIWRDMAWHNIFHTRLF